MIMGCPHSQFDRDDFRRKTPEGTRDWAQGSTVMNEMADSLSGFIAYNASYYYCYRHGDRNGGIETK
jgi:hypothetical protein